MQTYCGEYGSPEAELYVKEYVHEINRFRFNWHDFLELIVVVNGRMEAYVGGQRHCLEEDDVLLINSNVGHATLLRQVGTKAIVVRPFSAAASRGTRRSASTVFPRRAPDSPRLFAGCAGSPRCCCGNL